MQHFERAFFFLAAKEIILCLIELTCAWKELIP